MSQSLLNWFEKTASKRSREQNFAISSPAPSSSTSIPPVEIEEDSSCSGPVLQSSASTATKTTAQKTSRVLPSEPHQPKLNYPKCPFGNQQWGFSASWYHSHPWLYYLQEEDAVLCFYCASAVQLKMPNTGYTDKDLQKQVLVTGRKP